MKARSPVIITALVVGLTMAAVPSVAHDKPDESTELPDDWEPPVVEGGAGPGANANAPDHANNPKRFAPCINGTAYLPEFDGHPILGTGAFPCDGVDLLYYFPGDEIGGGMATGSGRGSDVWGWTDPETGTEYVLAGKENGTAIVDISDPKRPVYLAELPTSSPQDLIWRDIKTYADHAFIVAESPQHGMQVLDLTRLRDLDPEGAPHTLDEDALYEGFQRAHNIAINADSGFAYAVGAREDVEGCASGMHMIDISDPVNPTFAGCYTDDGYVHDAHCVIYEGPDTRFTDREICIAASPNAPSGHTATVVDVTDKQNPETLSVNSYPNPAYSHQGWLLDGHRYYIHNSETTSRTPQGLDIFDMADLTAPEYIGFFENPAQSTHHNLYQKNRYAYQSNYSSGLRIYDTRDIAEGELTEVAYFDVYPPHDDPGFGLGTWSNYPWFDSGVVAVHGYQGLFLVKPRVGERRP